MTTVRCSLVVLNYNEKDLLLQCLSSLLKVVNADDEIIVVDNGSEDGSSDAVRQHYPECRILTLPSNRYIFGLNAGLAEARGEFVAFCNNDMTVEPGFVDEALKLFTSSSVFAVCARIKDRHGAEQGSRTAAIWRRGLLFYKSLPHSDIPTRSMFAVGGQSFYRRQTLLELGSIDELLWPMYHEDIELSYRAWKAGYEVLYAPDSVCHHLGGTTSRKVFTKTQLRSFVRQNEVLTVWKDITDRKMLLEHFVWLPIRFFKALLVGDMGTVRGLLAAMGRAPAALRARREVRPSFTLSDRDVLSVLSEGALAVHER